MDVRPTDPRTGLIQAYLLDGAGGAVRTDQEGVERWTPADGGVWVHMDMSAGASAGWLSRAAELPEWVVEALVEPGGRPRAVVHGEGVLVVLRGPNLNVGAEATRLIPLAVWVDEHRLITLRVDAMRSITALRESWEAGSGPATPAGGLRFLLGALEDRATDVVADLGARLEELSVTDVAGDDEIAELTALRRGLARLRRFFVPQRDAVKVLSERAADEGVLPWLGGVDAVYFSEMGSAYSRLVDEIDALREEAALVSEDWTGRSAERTSVRLYLLSVLTAVFLPLTLVTGMLGMNVGGVPWAAWGGGFWAVTGGLVVAAVVSLVWAKVRRWI